MQGGAELRRIRTAAVDQYSPMRLWGVLALGIVAGLAATTANKESISISEQSIVVRLVLTGRDARHVPR